MNLHSTKSLFFSVLLCFLTGACLVRAQKGTSDYIGPAKIGSLDSSATAPSFSHRFRWNRWEYSEDIEVFMDGFSLGKGKIAVSKLVRMTFPKASYLQIDLPAIPDGAFTGANRAGFSVSTFFEEEGFLRKWICQGARIQFLINGDPAEIHTLAALDKSNNSVEPFYSGTFRDGGLTSGIFVFDGKEYDTMEGTVEGMAAVPWVKGSILMICHPGPIVLEQSKPSNGLESVVRFLQSRGLTLFGLGLRTL